MQLRVFPVLITGFLSIAAVGISPAALSAQEAVPVIENVRIENNVSAKTVTIRYDVSDDASGVVEVLFKASFDEGRHFLVNTETAAGDVGMDVPVGADRSITWYYGDFWDNIEGKTIRLVADDGYRPDISDLVDQVDGQRMWSHLEYICEPRSFQVNTEHLYDVRDSLIALSDHYNYETILQEFQHRGRTATNVIGRKAGLGDEATTYIMDAHYDANIDAPGADDNGSGVVGFLEAMRILSPYQFDKSIEFIGFDQEEEGLLGSINYAWLGGIEGWKTVAGVLNYEMIGYFTELPNSQMVPFGFDLLFEEQYNELVENEFRGDFIFITGNEASASIVEAFHQAAETYVPALKVISAVVPLNGLIAPDLLRSDHAPFWFKGIPAIMITDGSEFRNHNYHTLYDLIDSLDMDFMREVAQAGLATLVEMAGLRHAAVKTIEVQSVVTGTSTSILSECIPAIFPNPASDRLHVDLGSCRLPEIAVQLELLDITGRLVADPQILHTAYRTNIDVSHLECGAYILRFLTNNEELARQIIIY